MKIPECLASFIKVKGCRNNIFPNFGLPISHIALVLMFLYGKHDYCLCILLQNFTFYSLTVYFPPSFLNLHFGYPKIFETKPASPNKRPYFVTFF